MYVVHLPVYPTRIQLHIYSKDVVIILLYIHTSICMYVCILCICISRREQHCLGSYTRPENCTVAVAGGVVQTIFMCVVDFFTSSLSLSLSSSGPEVGRFCSCLNPLYFLHSHMKLMNLCMYICR